MTHERVRDPWHQRIGKIVAPAVDDIQARMRNLRLEVVSGFDRNQRVGLAVQDQAGLFDLTHELRPVR